MKPKRQGDLWFSPIQTRKKGKKVEKAVLAYGEDTGHSHQLQGDVSVIELNEEWLPEIISADGEVTHEEHGKIALKGTYKVLRKREYDPFLKAMRKVVD